MKRLIGYFLVLLTIGIALSNLTLTGAVTSDSNSNYSNLISIIFLFIGMILLSSEEKSKLKNIKNQKRN